MKQVASTFDHKDHKNIHSCILCNLNKNVICTKVHEGIKYFQKWRNYHNQKITALYETKDLRDNINKSTMIITQKQT